MIYALNQQDPELYDFALNIVTNGADICRSTDLPGQSANYCGITDPKVIDLVTKKLLHHLDHGHIDGPYDDDELPVSPEKLHYSPVFGFQKPNSDKASFIVHLSAPHVSDGTLQSAGE